LCYWILKENGHVLSKTTVQHVTRLDTETDDVKAKIIQYDEALSLRLDDDNFRLTPDEDNAFFMLDTDGIEDETVQPEPGNEHAIDVDDILPEDDPTEEAYDNLLNAEVLIIDGGEQVLGTVAKRARGADGRPIGQRSNAPMSDTRMYEVRLPDGSSRELTYNIIAENLFSQCDTEGRQFQIIKEISDHRSDDTAIRKGEEWINTKSGKRRKLTTRGWSFLVEWKDGSADWIALKDLKGSCPVELAEYAVANNIDDEPAIAWWCNDVLRKRNRIISKVKSRYWKTTHKFGVRMPKSIQEAFSLDTQNNNDLWRKSIEKEMSKARVAFERVDGFTPDDVRQNKALVGYQEIKGHWIFDIKMDGKFTRKARFVAGGHMTEPPASMTYSTVVTRESVRIAFMLASLNDLDVEAADISNAYLNAPCREKIWIVAGPEFGSDEGCVMKVVRAWYGLKSSGASWHAMLSQSMTDMGYTRCKADHDVWMRPAIKPNGFEYYEYVLIFVDDILHLSHDTKPTMKTLARIYELKADSVGPPDRYLGANVGKYQLEDGSEAWFMSAHDYVKSACSNVASMLEKEGLKLPTGRQAERPYHEKYRPEVDTTDEVGDELTSRYQQLIGVLRWAVELGRFDIHVEVAKLSSFNCMPRKGHLEAVYNIFGYLRKHENSKIVFDPRRPDYDESRFVEAKWKDLYGDVTEDVPMNKPEARGTPVKVSLFSDADHAGNLLTRRSHTGLMIFLNNSLIDWYSKGQATVESSTFGSETIALRTGVDKLQALRYKLYMMGVPIDGACDVFCDNQSVCLTAQKPETRLNKKHNAINYHRIREAAAAQWIRVAFEPGISNLADFLTKILPIGKRKNLLWTLTR
jgi:hypothetical protein